mmetsp:Transcript_101901/g.233348  ORF Transcript_101901/g.233348 Transcript_101901/m.233348 type:complete len:228 (+) Transcript_101901:295-978(+)
MFHLVLISSGQETHLHILCDLVVQHSLIRPKGLAVLLELANEVPDQHSAAVITTHRTIVHTDLQVHGGVLGPHRVVEPSRNLRRLQEIPIEQPPQVAVDPIQQLLKHVHVLRPTQVAVGVQVPLGLRHVGKSEIPGRPQTDLDFLVFGRFPVVPVVTVVAVVAVVPVVAVVAVVLAVVAVVAVVAVLVGLPVVVLLRVFPALAVLAVFALMPILVVAVVGGSLEPLA